MTVFSQSKTTKMAIKKIIQPISSDDEIEAARATNRSSAVAKQAEIQILSRKGTETAVPKFVAPAQTASSDRRSSFHVGLLVSMGVVILIIIGLISILSSSSPSSRQYKYLQSLKFPDSMTVTYQRNAHFFPCLDTCPPPTITLSFSDSTDNAMSQLKSYMTTHGNSIISDHSTSGSNPYSTTSFTSYNIDFAGSTDPNNNCSTLNATAGTSGNGTGWIGLTCRN